MSACNGCALNYYECIAKFHTDNKTSLEFLRNHGVLPTLVKCPTCNNNCSFREDQQIWRCRQTYLVGKTKIRRHCEYSVSDSKDTFLHNVNLPPWKVILFVNHWLSKCWDHRTVVQCLKVSPTTSYEWRLACSQVTDFWFENQGSIGGPGLVVEVDKALIVHNSEKGKDASQIWLFGGVERDTGKWFTVPLIGPVGEWQEHSTLLPLIKRFIRAGTVIISDQWGAYHSLRDHGYTHHVVSHFEHQREPGIDVHTDNIERLWKELKDWVKRPGIKSNYFYQELAKRLFIKAHKTNNLLHNFFVQVALLFPHQGGQRRVPSAPPVESLEEIEDC